MPSQPFVIDPSENIKELITKIQMLFDELFVNLIAGAEVGDVFNIGGDDVFTLTLATDSGLEKISSALRVKIKSTGGITRDSNGLSIKIKDTSDLNTDADGLYLVGLSKFAFVTIACPAGTNPVADAAADQLNLAVGSNKITITGTAGTDTVTFDIVEGNINHDNLSGFVGNEHIDWTNASNDLKTSGEVQTGTQFDVAGTNGVSGWFDDGANFRITVTGGIITAIDDSTAGGHS